MGMMKPLRYLLMAMAMTAPALVLNQPASAQVAFEFRVNFAPPELPVYEQPICPGDGYIWTPGYWAWDDADGDYYWVPGTWVEAPQPGYLWTPGYWGWYNSAYVFYPGYWGPVVGFYGGINYGFGYFGHGYDGGRWEGGRFFYNRAYSRINDREVRNVYENRVEYRNEGRVSFNGGNGGVSARATAQEEAAARERHMGAVAAQQQQVNAARGDRSLRASENRGKPPIAATSRPGSFSGGGVVAAREGGRYTPPPNRGGNANAGGRPGNDTTRPGAGNQPERTDRPPAARNDAGGNRSYVHPSELPKNDRPQPKPSGDARADQRYQQQQDKMYQKQEQDHQKLQQKQDQEHARATQRQSNEAQKQQMEQHHQQQTQQMEQRHTQQQQHMEQRAPQPKQSAPPHGGGEPHH
jgi:hypothetical protein